MSLLIVSPSLPAPKAAADTAAQRAKASAFEQGFTDPVELNWGLGAAWWYPTPGNPRGSGACVHVGQRFAAYVGAAYWKGMSGAMLLRALLDTAPDPRRLPLRDISGSFAMLLGSPSEVWLFNDAVGLQKMYQGAEQRVLSSSVLACHSAQGGGPVDRLRAAEYVLVGSNRGLQTALAGGSLLDPTCAVNLLDGSSSVLHASAEWVVACPYRTREEAAEDIARRISQDFASMVSAFVPRVGMALSGGFDSRLLLATLDNIGVAPELFVYGKPGAEDVLVAKAVADSLGAAIQCVDKASVNAKPLPMDAALLQRNLLFFDGLPPDGVFDRGAEQQTRLLQVQAGKLRHNGGGGEIVRNFFYLRPGPYTAAQLVAAFCSNWLPFLAPDRAEREAVTRLMQDEFLISLGREPGRGDARPAQLPRQEVELVYSLVRLRYWMVRNNALSPRYDALLTPLAHTVARRWQRPFRFKCKDFGMPEAQIIHRLSPWVARVGSPYCQAFDSVRGLKAKIKVTATSYRPLALRRRSAILRDTAGRLKPLAAPAEWLAGAGTASGVDWIVGQRIAGNDQLNRFMSLQALLATGASSVAMGTVTSALRPQLPTDCA
jgi:hypothetical protein